MLRAMDPMLDIPKDRSRPRVGRICLLMAMTALLFIFALHRRAGAAGLVAAALPIFG